MAGGVHDRAEASASFDLEAHVLEKLQLRRSGNRSHGEIGAWHTHTRSSSGQPSRQDDLITWLSAHDFLDRAFCLGAS